MTLRYDPKLKSSVSARVNNKSISSFWGALSKADYEGLLAQMKHYKTGLKLNDWGYNLLTYRTAQKIYGKRDEVSANLFTWFMLAKSDYDVKIGYNDNNVFVLLPSKNKLFGITYLTLDKKRYYLQFFDGKKKKMG